MDSLLFFVLVGVSAILAGVVMMLLCRRLAGARRGLLASICVMTLVVLASSTAWAVWFGFEMVRFGTDGAEAVILWVMCPLIALACTGGALLGMGLGSKGEMPHHRAGARMFGMGVAGVLMAVASVPWSTAVFGFTIRMLWPC